MTDQLKAAMQQTLCWLGFHRHEWIPIPYHYRCSRCGKETYVGP